MGRDTATRAPRTYGTRPIQFLDTGERAEIVTIDGEPVALAPSRALLEEYAQCHELRLVTTQVMDELLRHRTERGR